MGTAQNNFNKGLFLDSREFYQPDGTYPFALNAIDESVKGPNIGSLSNEEGNVKCLNLPTGSNPIGSILLSQNEYILFLKNPDSILLVDSLNNTYTTLIQSTCLNFQRQIQGVYRTINGCDRIIYFVDGLNEDRVINIDNILRNPTSHNYLNKYGVFDCELIKNKRNFEYPCINNITVQNTGGVLELGVYQIVLQYEDGLNNGTSYFGHSLPIPIVNGSYGSDYKDIIGGDPLTFPSTTKSITFELNNVDTTYTYLNIIIGHTKNGITTYYLVDKLPIVSKNFSYNFNKLITADSIQIDSAKILVDQADYRISETITQIDNRLIKGNLKQTIRDFSAFQQYANDIKVTYVTKPILYGESSIKTKLPKNSKYYSDNRSYLRDEVYSLGIVWVFKDGSTTPAFHIPGRQKNISRTQPNFPTSDSNNHSRPNNNTGVGDTGWDSALLTTIDSGGLSSEYKHLQESDFTKIGNIKYIERWKAYNTAYRKELNTATSEYYSKGDLAYFETEYRYPDTKDCNDNYVYPVEIINGKYVGKKVTHHKMPDTTLEEHFVKESGRSYILPLGLEFNNIKYPPQYSNDIIGYYLVREQRDELNKTILDKGIIHENGEFSLNIHDSGSKKYTVQTTISNKHHRNSSPSTRGLIPYKSSIDFSDDVRGGISLDTFHNDVLYTHDTFSFHGANSKFLKSSFNTTLFKIERVLKGSTKIIKFQLNDWNDLSRFYYDTEYTDNIIFNIPLNTRTNLALRKNPIYIDSDSEIPKGYLTNHFLNNNAQETCVFETIDTLYDISSTEDYSEENVGVNLPSDCYYGSIKLYNNNIYGSINSKKYYKLHNCVLSKNVKTTIQFGGDSFINKFSFFKSSLTKCYPTSMGTPIGFNVVKDMVTFFIESDVNTELRHYDINNLDDKNNIFWNNYNGTIEDFFNTDWNGTDFNNDDETLGAGSAWVQGNYLKNLYLYNTDYSKSDTIKPFFSLDINYQFCKECNESFPERIIYSETGNQEEKSDNYRVFYANNYRDLPANTGSITNLFTNFEELYGQTKLGLYKIITRPYQINTNQATLYVGTGEFFSVPPKQFVSVDYGYAGSTQKFGTKSTEHGTILIDDVTGKVLILTDNIKELSNEGLRNWFEENIELKFNNQYKKQFGKDYELNNQPALKNGIGFITTYDPRHKRIIITKIDYEALTTIPDVIDFTDTSKFRNNSWTISYSFLSSSWKSWHSYLPNFYINDNNTFYSSILSKPGLWKHNQTNFLNFYGEECPHIIEFVVKSDSGQTTTLDTLSYISKAEKWDDTTRQWIDKDYVTFNKIIAYNSYQSTGEKSIEIENLKDPFSSILYSSSNCLASKTEKLWNINNLRDYVSDRDNSLFTSKWSDIKSNYFIDKVPNLSVINENKSPFELEMLRDKYFNIRLFYNNTNNINYKITTDIFISLNNESYR